MYLSKLLTALLIVPAAVIASPTPVTRSTDVNPFEGKNFYANSIYAKKLETTIKTFLKKGELLNAGRVRTVQKTGTFGWISSFSDLEKLPTYIGEAWTLQKLTKKKQIVELVVYNLPDRDCSAKSSDGELKIAQGGEQKYKEFVDKVYKQLASSKAKDLTFAVILEPDSLGNVVTNLAVEKCAGAAEAYKHGIAYAINKLQLPNVHLYIDATHGGWLGWDGNLPLTAELFGEVVALAGPKAKIRGFATNVSNYNAFHANPRENFTEWSNSWDESHFVNSLKPHLEAHGLPAKFIVDTGRSGALAVRSQWGHWCNIEGAGFGPLPTTATNDTLVDALVWAKPGGESDGTSDSTSARFDEMCVGVDAKTPAPEAGAWFDEYVVDLVKNANPPLKPSFF